MRESRIRGPNALSSVAFSFAPEHARHADRRTSPQRTLPPEKLNVDCSATLGRPETEEAAVMPTIQHGFASTEMRSNSSRRDPREVPTLSWKQAVTGETAESDPPTTSRHPGPARLAAREKAAPPGLKSQPSEWGCRSRKPPTASASPEMPPPRRGAANPQRNRQFTGERAAVAACSVHAQELRRTHTLRFELKEIPGSSNVGVRASRRVGDWVPRGPNAQAQSRSASHQNMCGAPTGAQVRSAHRRLRS
jgi:hypothetical protein